ncbi:TetR/AcrR family transcriptional regulator [Leeia aquatica]|uniref:TetR/AcrR family transcriptional regulator n=1 Tax=Leeia aquatica TaxID=2725557 RepID=A0A847SAF2_9NEIS|nr:TetR/AcrR family transcriptional regulator [Leeia aquatica]NLR75907.1 TetR/AcrR family transcriptional regulator [Leeia aquatica]
MGRNRNFNEHDVLTGAMHAFRQHGYAALSIRDLSEATGISAGSLYHGFGDKHELYAAAFEHYLQHVLHQRIHRHAPPEKGLDGVRQLFLTLLEEPGGTHHGCLITNAAVEFADHPLPGNDAVQRGFDILRHTFQQRLEAAQTKGTLAAGVMPSAAAIKLLALYQGILVMLRTGYDTLALQQAILQEFASMQALTRET